MAKDKRRRPERVAKNIQAAKDASKNKNKQNKALRAKNASLREHLDGQAYLESIYGMNQRTSIGASSRATVLIVLRLSASEAGQE
ncbi:BZIP domain-containing protein [Pleurotus pulmonarius]